MPAEAAPTKASIRLLGDRVLVRPVAAVIPRHGGIIIPESDKDRSQEGEVLACGRGKLGKEGKTMPMQVKAGDRILYGKQSSIKIKIDGEERLILRHDDILGILTSEGRSAGIPAKAGPATPVSGDDSC